MLPKSLFEIIKKISAIIYDFSGTHSVAGKCFYAIDC